MHLLELRTSLIKQTGRYGLVGKTLAGQPDYAVDNGIDAFINAAIVDLCNRMPSFMSRYAKSFTHYDGDRELWVPNLSAPEMVRVTNSDDEILKLTPATYDEMVRYYGEDFSVVDEGEPLYWCIAPEDENSIGPGLLLDPDIDDDANWTYGAGLVHGASRLTAAVALGADAPFYSDALRIPTPHVFLEPGAYPGKTVIFEVGAQIYTGQIDITIFDTTQNPAFSPDGVPLDPVDTFTMLPVAGEPFYRFALTNFLGQGDMPVAREGFVGYIEWFNVYTPDLYQGARKLILMPPADLDYTVEVQGVYRPELLLSYHQTNRLTLECPQLLMDAVRFQMAKSLANDAEAKQFNGLVEQGLHGLRRAQTLRDIAHMRGANGQITL